MIGAVYFRFARDEDRAYKEAVCSELLRALGHQIPMRMSPFITSTIKYATDTAERKSGMTARQAAERIKREMIMKDIIHRATQSFGITLPHESSTFSGAKQNSGINTGGI